MEAENGGRFSSKPSTDKNLSKNKPNRAQTEPTPEDAGRVKVEVAKRRSVKRPRKRGTEGVLNDD